MKRKLLIAGGVLLALVVVVIIALSVLVKFYLKSEQLKARIIPLAEEFTGRQVSIDRIDVSLFKGIVVKKLDVREEGREFVSVEEFVLAYDLMPLLRKQLVVHKIELISPSIHVKRLKDGSFNFSDMLEKPGKEEQASEEESGGLPISIVTDRVILKDAKLEFVDEMREIPDVSAETDADFKVSLEEKISAEGYLDLKKLEATLGGIRTNTTGRVDIKKDLIQADITSIVDKKPIDLKATIRDYATSPDIEFDLDAEELDIDKLMALAGAGKSGKKKEEVTSTASKSGKKPLKIKASGTADVKTAKYGEYALSDLSLDAGSAIEVTSSQNSINGDVDLRKLSASMQGIKVNASGKINLANDTVKTALNAVVEVAESYRHEDYTLEKARMDVSPRLTYNMSRKDVAGNVGIKELRAASVKSKDISVTGLALSGDADVAYNMPSKKMKIGANIKSLRANYDGIDVSAAGRVTYDGNTVTAALKEATASTDEYTYETYSLKGVSASVVTDITVDLKEKLPTGGTMELKELKANVNGINTAATGKLNAGSKKLTADLKVDIDKDSVKLTATAIDYKTAPDVKFDLYSKKLDIGKLKTLSGPEKKETAPGGKRAAGKKEKPKKLTARGTVKIDRADYEDYSIEGLNATLSYVNDVLTVDPVKMALKGGTKMVIDGTFQGNVSFKYPRGSEEASEIMKRTMTGKGQSKFKKIQIKDVKVADAIAKITSVEELSNPTFTDSELNYVIKDRKVNLDGFMNDERIKVVPKGYVGLDKAIDMEINLNLDPMLSRRLIITQFMRQQDGSSTVPLIVKGTTDDPKVSVDAEKVMKKEVDKGIKKLFEKIIPQKQEEPAPTTPPAEETAPPAEQTAPAEEPAPAEEKPEEPIKELFKGIFGK